jgi:cation:H+ antiporter
MVGLYAFIFIGSVIMLALSGDWLVGTLARIARFLGWREFVVAFIVMAIAASIPNLFVAILSALQKIPQLSFGDVIGGNVVDLTISIGLATLFSATGILTKSKMVQTTSIFTIIAAILPLILIFDGELSRIDGILLISVFVFYIFWLFSKRERFSKVYDEVLTKEKTSITKFLKDLGAMIGSIIILLLSAQGIILSAKYFADFLGLPLVLVGILIVGLGNALPETYFAVASAKKGETWMILGNLMGAVIVPATLVLGILALINPFVISDFSPLILARVFLLISAIYFLISVKTDQKISKSEGIFFLSLYILFILLELLQR